MALSASVPVLVTIVFSAVYCLYTAYGIGTLDLISQRHGKFVTNGYISLQTRLNGHFAETDISQRAIIWLSAKGGTDSVIAFALIYKLARFVQDGHTFTHTRT